MHKLLGSIINKFDAEAKNHMERQSLNPFSGSFSRSPSPRLSKDQYGKPLAGSKTEERGQKAKCHILREIQDLCNCIHDLGTYNKSHKQKDDDSDDESKEEDEIIITFGEIFQMYTNINDKVVGLLIAAKKRGFIYFEKEILFQRRDDDVLIALIKPIKEIRAIISKELAINSSPIPMSSRGASPAVMDTMEPGKVNGAMTNGTAGGSSKSSSNSPDKDVNKASPKSPKSIQNGKLTKDQNANGQAIIKEEKVSKKNINQDENNATLQKPTDLEKITSEATKNPPANDLIEINTTSISLVPTESEITLNQEIPINNEDRKPEDEKPKVDQENVVPEAEIIPKLEVTSEIQNSNDEVESTPNPTSEIALNLIPTIEISEAATPECENPEDEFIVKTEKVNSDEGKSNQEADIKISDSDSSDPIENEENKSNENVDNKSNENISLEIVEEIKQDLNENANVDSAVLPEQPKEEVPISTGNFEPQVNDTSKLLANQELIQVNLSNDNERKRTFSNEELIESLSAALSGRCTSPDICDEEVEQILQSQNAVSTMFPESPIENTSGSEILVNNDSSSQETPLKESPSEIITETPSSFSDVVIGECVAEIEPNVILNAEPNAESKVEPNVESNTELKLESNVELNIEQNMETNVEKNVESNIEQNIGSNIEQNVDSNVEQNVESNADPNVEEIVESNVKVKDTVNKINPSNDSIS